MPKIKKTLLFAIFSIIINVLIISAIIVVFSHKTTPSYSKESNTFSVLGTSKGIYLWVNKEITKIWDKGSVKKVINTPNGHYFLTDMGILFSDNLKSFEYRNTGIKEKVIKHFENNQTSYFKEPETLSDLSYDINNPNNLIASSKNGVYLSLNNGLSWRFFPTTSNATGIKAVALYTDSRGTLNLFFGHPYEGVYHKTVAKTVSDWKRIDSGLKQQGGYREEIASLALLKTDPTKDPSLYASQNFSPNLYLLNENKNNWIHIYSPPASEKVRMLESLSVTPNGNIIFILDNSVMLFNQQTKTAEKLIKVNNALKEFYKPNESMNSISIFNDGKFLYSLSDLWLLQKPPVDEYKELANHKKGIYMQADALSSSKRMPHIMNILKSTNLNMITVDMKDDYGYLRFVPQDPMIQKVGKYTSPINIEKTIDYLHRNNIYAVARIPVFKDKILFNYNNGTLTIKDKTTNGPWRGIKNASGKFNAEFWVDPYNTTVWEYNIKIAQELLKRGFDEIQFDYIRFPTDGKNLSQMVFNSQGAGMDKDSGIISFLRYARYHIKGPISVDIYGANGWLRTGARTGQDVEMLAEYVDVIAPMYYPSHFSKGFLLYPPYEDRSYRIYYKGGFRNYYIARKSVIVRPYIQAFSLSYLEFDKKYFGPSYIEKQIEGVDQSIDMGYTFWNSATRYSILLDTFLTRQTKEA